MSFKNIKNFVDSQVLYGRVHTCSFRKVPADASTALNWVDLSRAAGNPVPNYYASSPLQAKAFDGMDGIFHGDNKAPSKKYLSNLVLMSPTAALVGRFMLLDYLLYYPFVDGDSGDEQVLVNEETVARYTDGAGVQVMCVAVTPTLGGGQFTFTYMNQNGELKTSPVQTCATTASSISTLITSQQATAAGGRPFLTLASGDTGVRSIQSVTFSSPAGGLFSFVLVVPLLNTAIYEINTAKEVELIRQAPILPRIYDGAYLNFICNPAGSVAAGQLTGLATGVWSE